MNSFKTFICILIMIPTLIFGQWEKIDVNGYSDWSYGFAIDAYDSNSVLISVSIDQQNSPNLLKTLDQGISWVDITPKDAYDESFWDCEMLDPNHLWVIGSKIWHSSDGGSSWTIQYYDTNLTRGFSYIEMFDLNNGVAMGDAVANSQLPLFLKTVNGGESWIVINDDSIGGYAGDNWRRIDFISPKIGYFQEHGITAEKRLFKTINGCNDWELTNYSGGVNNLKFFDMKIGLIRSFKSNSVTQENTPIISRTIDGGDNWEEFITDFEGWGNDFEFVPGKPSNVWFVNGGGNEIYYSTDTGKTWTGKDFSDINLTGRDIVLVDENHGWILGDNGNLLYTNNNGGIITDVEKIGTEEIPNEIVLYQNYPNPFNPTTTLKYNLPEASNVNIKIYNNLGKEVKELINNYQSAGVYEIDFNGNNLASGIYYYRIITDFTTQTKMMQLIK